MPSLLIVGGLTIDRFADGSRAPGGSVLHAGLAAAAEGAQVTTLTVAGASGTPPLASDGGDDNVPAPADKDANVFTFLPQTSGIYNVAVRGTAGSGGSYDLEVKLSTNTAPPAGALYGGSIKTDLSDAMYGVNASAYLRVPFEYDSAALPGGLSALTLGMKYDDGFVAYLNGTEVARRNVTVNAVAPGPIWTPLIPATMDEDKVEGFGEQTPMGRAGQPAELASAFVFLASPESSYVTGEVIAVTGGQPVTV